MFGWEFPPFNSGGLGTACYGLTKGLNNHNKKVTFVLPKADDSLNAEFVKIVSAEDEIKTIKGMKKMTIKSLLQGYITKEEYKERVKEFSKKIKLKRQAKNNDIYGKNLFEEVWLYGQRAGEVAENEEFDIIHAHDWMTYEAGINAKKVSGKPLVIHVHATEFDRTGDNPNQCVYDIERKGMHEEDSIIAVSKLTKEKIVKHYGVPKNKVNVVHNAVEFNDNKFNQGSLKINDKEKVVLFLGRITIQKGPDYFLYAAKKALEVNPDIKFIVAGSGDMEQFMIEKTAELDIADKVLFTWFLRGKEIDKAYQMEDLEVMTSVSEPFGITTLEAMRNNTPVLISKQSGVSEVLNNCLKVDFWDINQMVNKIIWVVKYQEISQSLKEHGNKEIKKFNWDIPAKKCIEVYKKTLDKWK